jgi:hypothetical protein
MVDEKKIYITSTGIRIHPYDAAKCSFIERFTTVFNKAIFKREHVTGFMVHDEYLTHHFSMELLNHWLPDYKICVSNYVKPKYTEPYEMKSTEQERDKIKGRAAIQMDILQKLYDEKSNQVFVNIQTGYGKTYMAVFYSCSLQYKTLVLCYSTKILYQWYNAYKNLTSIDENRILQIHSSETLLAILNGELDTTNYDIFVCTPRLIDMFCDQHGWESIGKITEIMGIGLKIFDEAHRDIGNIVRINASTNVGKTLYLSADFNQADPLRRQLYYRMFYNVPVLRAEKVLMNDLKYINAIVVKYNSDPSMEEVMGVYNKRYGFSNYKYMKYQIEKGKIVDILERTIDTIFKSDKTHRILILLNMIKHVDMLYEKLKEKYGDKFVGRFHSEVEKDEKEFAINNSTIIVSTYQSFGVGIDAKNIRHVLSPDQVNEVYDNQAAGRARPLESSLECYYYMFIDTGFEYSVKKLQRRLRYLVECKIRNIFKLNF